MTTALASKPQLRIVPPDEPIKIVPTRRTPVEPKRIDTYNSHPSVGLTVEMLLSFFREAERGMPVRQFDCFDDLIEIDGHLRGLIAGRIEAVAGCEMVVKPGREDKPSRIAADALAERLGELSLHKTIAHQLTAPHYGIACSSIVWDYVEGVVAPVKFIDVAHRRFASPSQDRADKIMLIAGDNVRELAELEPGLWFVSRYRGRNPWSAGLMRTCAWWSMIKRWAIRDWQVFAEMFGLPLVVGYYEEGASEESRKALEDAVRLIGEDGYAVLSNLTEIVISQAARAGDSSTVYPKIIDTAEAQQSKAVVGATLTTDVGGKGSYALGSIHESRQYARERADARDVQADFQACVGVPFIVWNGYDRAAAPHLSIKITRDSLERAKTLQVVGSIIALDEGQLREEFHLLPPADGVGVKFAPKAPPGGDDAAP